MHEGAEIIISFTVNPIDLALWGSLAALLFWNLLYVCVSVCVCTPAGNFSPRPISIPSDFCIYDYTAT